MAVFREPPKCERCGESLEGIYRESSIEFVGDAFICWDWESHKCKDETKETMNKEQYGDNIRIQDRPKS